MENSTRLHSQVAAMAGVSSEAALTAVYLLNLSRAGKSIDDAASLSRMERADVRDVARDWGFSFRDYTPAKPLSMTWAKIKRGHWELRDGDNNTIATIDSDGDGSYNSVCLASSLYEKGSSPLIAARRISKAIDRQSVAILGLDDIAIHFRNPDGSTERLAPVPAEDPRKLKTALLG